MPIGNTAGARLLNKDFGGQNYTPLGSFWLGFRNGGVELTNGNSPGYARSEVEVGIVSFPDTETTMISNGVAFTTPPTGNATGNWLEADEVVLYDEETAGELQYSGFLDQPFSMVTGQKRSFAIGALRVRFI